MTNPNLSSPDSDEVTMSPEQRQAFLDRLEIRAATESEDDTPESQPTLFSKLSKEAQDRILAEVRRGVRLDAQKAQPSMERSTSKGVASASLYDQSRRRRWKRRSLS